MALTRKQHMQRAEVAFGVMALLIFGLITWNHLTSSSRVSEGPALMSENMVGCHNRQALDPILKSVVEKRNADFKRLINAFTWGGLCVVLKKGQPVIVENHAQLEGMSIVQVHLKDGKQKYWTVANATNL